MKDALSTVITLVILLLCVYICVYTGLYILMEQKYEPEHQHAMQEESCK